MRQFGEPSRQRAGGRFAHAVRAWPGVAHGSSRRRTCARGPGACRRRLRDDRAHLPRRCAQRHGCHGPCARRGQLWRHGPPARAGGRRLRQRPERHVLRRRRLGIRLDRKPRLALRRLPGVRPGSPAAARLSMARRIATPCPACGAPGWGRTGTIGGLACERCHAPTTETRFEVLGCVKCAHSELGGRRDGRKTALASGCVSCTSR